MVAIVASIFIVSGLVITGFAGSSHVAQATLWAVSSFSIATVVGFLFGIPKVLQGEDLPKTAVAGSVGDRRYEQRVNTNLEQISDWLTKIIVGLGLVNLGAVPGRLEKLGVYLVADTKIDPMIASCTVVY
ncbi:MAG: hypothetical protein AAGA30_18820, partial [Planctomycetota bacterium]